MSGSRARSGLVAAAGAILFSLVCAAIAHRLAPFPSANTERASESPFSYGLEEREFVPPMMGPGRWTTAGASFRFRYLPPGPATIEVRIRNHQNAVRVLVDRRSSGLIGVGDRSGDFDLDLKDRDLRVDLVVKPFLARGGRRLGTFLDRVTVVHSRSFVPPLALILIFVGPAAACAFLAASSSMGAVAAMATASVVSILQTLLLWPQGILRSDYAQSLALLLTLGVVLSYGLAWLSGRLSSEFPRFAFVSALTAFSIQGVAATHPMVIGLDASFHGHNLVEVAYGNLYPESLTQHRPPFRFPYGVTFYLLLNPLARGGLDLVETVRAGAALSGLLASGALFWLVADSRGRSPAAALQATTAIVLYLFVPWTFEVFSNGNYSNIFSQAAALIFFTWWATGKPIGWPLGCIIFVIGALGHLSSFLFLLALVASLVLVHRTNLFRERRGLLAVTAGIILSLAYYAHFATLILEQLPRLLAGGHGGTGTQTAFDSLVVQLERALFDWGIPVVVLAVIGRPRGGTEMARDFTAFWLAGAMLFSAAVVTPLEARYLYALAPALAIAASSGVERLWALGTRGKLVASGLVAAQIGIGLAALVRGILYDWRV